MRNDGDDGSVDDDEDANDADDDDDVEMEMALVMNLYAGLKLMFVLIFDLFFKCKRQELILINDF